MDVSTFPVTLRTAQLLFDSIPAVRTRRYMEIVDRGDMRLAARLYLWNSYLAATVQRTTGIVEVLLRNVIDTSFAQWNSGEPRCGSSEWIEYPEAELAKIVLGRRNRSRGLASYSDVSSVRGIPTHDDLVAGLSFGSWVRLLPNKAAASNPENPRHVLWEEAIAPHLYQDDWVVLPKGALRSLGGGIGPPIIGH